MSKYRKRSMEVEAIQFTATNHDEVAAFIGDANSHGLESHAPRNRIEIHTLEGTITAVEGDYIIKGVVGEFYPCKPDIFKATYEPVKEKKR